MNNTSYLLSGTGYENGSEFNCDVIYRFYYDDKEVTKAIYKILKKKIVNHQNIITSPHKAIQRSGKIIIIRTYHFLSDDDKKFLDDVMHFLRFVKGEDIK